MADAENLGDGRHGQAALVGGSDGLVTLLAEVVARPLQGFLAPGIALGEGRQALASIGGLAFRSGDPLIV